MQFLIKPLLPLLSIIILLVSCQSEEVMPLKPEVLISYFEEAEALNFTENGFSGNISTEKAKALVKSYFKLNTISEEEFQGLFARLLAEEFQQRSKERSATQRQMNTGTIFVLAEVIVDGVRYTEYKEAVYSITSLSALKLVRQMNIPVGTRMESTVGQYPASGPSVTLSRKVQEVTSVFSCGGDEIARAQAIWQNQSAETYTLLKCDD
jgi:hypothetical protein